MKFSGLALGESLAAQPEPGALLILPFGGCIAFIADPWGNVYELLEVAGEENRKTKGGWHG